LIFIIHISSSTGRYIIWTVDRATSNNKKFWEEPVAYFPLIRHGPHRKQKRGWTQTGKQPSDLISLLKKILGGGYTNRQQGDLISLKNMEDVGTDVQTQTDTQS
jgi:hypothetical protein